MQSMALGLQAPSGAMLPNGGVPGNGNEQQQQPQVPKKEKKQKTNAQIVATKIAMLSGKNTEIMSWDARVQESEKLFLDTINSTFWIAVSYIYTLIFKHQFLNLRSETLKTGFAKELQARQTALADCKSSLETLYSEKLDDSKCPNLIQKLHAALRTCEAAMTSYNGTLKSVKTAIESCRPSCWLYCTYLMLYMYVSYKMIIFGCFT